MKNLLCLLLVVICFSLHAQLHILKDPFAHTYSIVARDSVTGQLGVAVQSHWYSVGNIVTWAEAGVGAIATQSFVNASFGPKGLELLKQGLFPQKVVDQLLSEDKESAFRQLAVVDAKGRVAVFTGEKCIREAGHIKGDGFSVQANLMLNDQVWPAMAQAFKTAGGPLAERLLSALKAAEAAGGDIRGKQSAAILVVSGTSTGKIWEDRLVDLRVADHEEPLKELERLLKVHRAYEHMDKGDAALAEQRIDDAKAEYGIAQKLMPENIEMKYWYAVALANSGSVEEALPVFKAVFSKDKNWIEVTRRISENGLLEVDGGDLKKILSL